MTFHYSPGALEGGKHLLNEGIMLCTDKKIKKIAIGTKS